MNSDAARNPFFHVSFPPANKTLPVHLMTFTGKKSALHLNEMHDNFTGKSAISSWSRRLCGRVNSVSTHALMGAQCADSSVPLAKYCLNRGLVFSFDPRCHGLLSCTLSEPRMVHPVPIPSKGRNYAPYGNCNGTTLIHPMCLLLRERDR